MALNQADLPACLATASNQVTLAKKLLSTRFNSRAVRVDRPDIEGCFSRTLLVALEDSREFAVQFRPKELDLDVFYTARKALGDVVPEIGVLEDDELKESGFHAYWMTRMPGRIWLHGIRGKGDEGRIAICKSLGEAFSKGFLDPDGFPGYTSAAALDKTVRPHLETILASDLPELVPFRNAIQGLVHELDSLNRLPLWIAHFDLNEVNVLIDDDCRVTGIIDWELSRPLPFGVGLGRIHTIVGEYSDGEFYMPDCFVEAEKAFWHAMLDGMVPEVRKRLEEMPDIVQLGVLIGTVMDCINMENGMLCISEISIKALDKFLTYRIPTLRGEDEPPYRK
ncbi:hypothetical protein MCOR05_008692 [Pyricularia oryzae]|nr:hypothetical protein MCOR05_008692 [Pyricularia oryzae]